MSEHECRYRARLEWGPWTETQGRRRRQARRVPRCLRCGQEQASRKPRAVAQIEEERLGCGGPPPSTPEGRRVAARLATKSAGGGRDVGFRGLASKVSLPESALEEHLEAFVEAGWVGLVRQVRRGREELRTIRVRDADALREFSAPGAREALSTARQEAARRLGRGDHPLVEVARRVLEDPDADGLGPGALRALAVVAAHAASGERLARRVLASRELGDSKALDRHRRAVEARLGPYSELGIREGAALALLGGRGAVELGAGPRLDLAGLGPYAGLSRECVLGLRGVAPPEDGLLVVENLTVFEACCRGEVAGVGAAMVLWSGGYPGRAERALIARARAGGAALRVWCDLDLDGVRIARQIGEAAGGEWAPWRMDEAELARVPRLRPLSPRSCEAIRRDLEAHPDAPLAGTLRALLERGVWAEQEALLGIPEGG